jgi:hypothetical protein
MVSVFLKSMMYHPKKKYDENQGHTTVLLLGEAPGRDQKN